MKKNNKKEIVSTVKKTKHTEGIKNKQGKAIGHKTIEKVEDKNFKGEKITAHAKDSDENGSYEEFYQEVKLESGYIEDFDKIVSDVIENEEIDEEE